MELKHSQDEADRLTPQELQARYDHWAAHAEVCLRGLKLATKHMENINRTIEVQKGLGVYEPTTSNEPQPTA